MSNPINKNELKIYSKVFSVLVMVLLVSFAFVPKFEPASLASNFRWRRDLINYYTSMRLQAGDKVYNNTLIGKHGWLFYTGDQTISDYQGMLPLKPKKLLNLQTRLDRLNAELKADGVILLVVIPPNKSTIYPQYMPDEIQVESEKTSLDQFVEYMKLNGETTILDLRATLLDASQANDVYFKTDTHWNDLGAYAAYVEILRALALDDPSLQPHPRSDFQYLPANDSVHDLPLLMGLSNYKEENWVLSPSFDIQLDEAKVALVDGRYIRTVTNADKKSPKLLVYGDSFYEALARFVEPHFSRTKTIPFTYEDEVWSLDWIQQEKPDVVILEIVERYLDVSLPLLLEN